MNSCLSPGRAGPGLPEQEEEAQGASLCAEISLHSYPNRLPPSFLPQSGLDPRTEQATEISAWQDPAPKVWPTSSVLTPPALSADHLFQGLAINIHSAKYLAPRVPTSQPWPPVPCSLNASLQSACNLNPLCSPSTEGLPELVCWGMLACPQDHFCKLMVQ